MWLLTPLLSLSLCMLSLCLFSHRWLSRPPPTVIPLVLFPIVHLPSHLPSPLLHPQLHSPLPLTPSPSPQSSLTLTPRYARVSLGLMCAFGKLRYLLILHNGFLFWLCCETPSWNQVTLIHTSLGQLGIAHRDNRAIRMKRFFLDEPLYPWFCHCQVLLLQMRDHHRHPSSSSISESVPPPPPSRSLMSRGCHSTQPEGSGWTRIDRADPEVSIQTFLISYLTETSINKDENEQFRCFIRYSDVLSTSL